jgi:hypothetical protein
MNSLTVLYYVLYFLCLSVTYSLTAEARFTTTPPFELLLTTFMPVTTRSRAKLLRGVDQDATKPISPESAIPPTPHTTITILTTTTTITTISSNSSLFPTTTHDTLAEAAKTSSSNSHVQCSTDLLSSSLEVSNFEISKFQMAPKLQFQTDLTPPTESLSTPLGHNFSFSKFCTMEADCEDSKPGPTLFVPNPDPMDKIQQLFASLSAQIDNQNVNMSQDFCQLVQDNAFFKQEVRAEIEELRHLFLQQHSSGSSGLSRPSTASNSTSSTGGLATMGAVNLTPSNPVPPRLSSSMESSSSTDMQTQMMYMLTESFSKLSTVLSERSSDTKSDWPKFSGDGKKFRSWYLAIIVQLSLPPWQELYDSSRHDVVSSTSNTSLNGKLYAKLLLSLEGIASQNIISRTHLRANGVLLFTELVQTYRPKNVPEVIAAKTSQFWGQTKRLPNESIDTYYNRFHELLQELLDGEETISTKSAIRHFLFTLGPEFETIQNNFRIGNLPSDWNTTDWPTIFILCRDYYNSVKPHGLSRREPSNNLNSTFDRTAHQKKVKEWFLSPVRFSKEIADEQAKYKDKCLYHLTKSHQTCDCHILKEGGKPGNSPKTSGQTSTTGQLRHVTEELDEDVLDESIEDDAEELGNDTNDDSLQYFTRVTNHYLRLVKSSPTE